MMDSNSTMRQLRAYARLIRLLKKAVRRGIVLNCDISLTGNLLLDNGIERMAEQMSEILDSNLHLEGDEGPDNTKFKVIHIGDMEVVEVDETETTEE